MRIATSAFQRILDEQKLAGDDKAQNRAISMWIYILIGRLLYEVNEKDRWQVLLFIKGVALGGKSSILKAVRNFYNTVDVAMSSATQEDKFGLSAYHNKYMFICHEVRRRSNVGQGDLQSIISRRRHAHQREVQDRVLQGVEGAGGHER